MSKHDKRPKHRRFLDPAFRARVEAKKRREEEEDYKARVENAQFIADCIGGDSDGAWQCAFDEAMGQTLDDLLAEEEAEGGYTGLRKP